VVEGVDDSEVDDEGAVDEDDEDDEGTANPLTAQNCSGDS